MGQARKRGTFAERQMEAIARHMRQAELVVLRADDPQANPDDWTPVLPADVPDAVRHPEVIGQLVKGKICQEVDGGPWYRAMRMPAAKAVAV